MLHKYYNSDNSKETIFVFAYGILLLSARFNNKEFYYFLGMIILLNFFFIDISMIKDETSAKQIILTIGLMLAKFIVLLSIDKLLNLFISRIKNYYSAVYIIFMVLFTPTFIIVESYLKNKIIANKTCCPVDIKLKNRQISNNNITNTIKNKIKFQLVLGVKEGEVSDKTGDYSFKVGKKFIRKQRIARIINVSLLCLLSIVISLTYSLFVFPVNWIIILISLAAAVIYIFALYIIKGKFIINYATITRKSYEYKAIN